MFESLGGESGSADTARDPRGFAMKFYTEEGNWDLVGNNTPIFFIRDPIFVSSLFLSCCQRVRYGSKIERRKRVKMFSLLLMLKHFGQRRFMYNVSPFLLYSVPQLYSHSEEESCHSPKGTLMMNDKKRNNIPDPRTRCKRAVIKCSKIWHRHWSCLNVILKADHEATVFVPVITGTYNVTIRELAF